MDKYLTESSPSPAVIISFPKRRGRPKQPPRPHNDMGTPELAAKRMLGETMEALDLCLERRLISPKQHWCGIHLRWLYTLRYGAPGARTIDPTHLGGMEIKNDDPLWRSARELEYHEAMRLLAASGHALLLVNLCIYNQRPLFLRGPSSDAADALIAVREGLDKLSSLWHPTTQ